MTTRAAMRWKTWHEKKPETYCDCGYNTSYLWVPGEHARHAARHRAYLGGKPLPKSFPLERIDDENIVFVPGTETGVVSRVVYYLARDFHRQCGFDFILWEYMGNRPMGENHVAYLYVHAKTHAVGVLLGKTGARFDTGEPISAIVRMIYTAKAYRRDGIARVLAERFARDQGISVVELAWEGPLTTAGVAVVDNVSGPGALVV